MCNTRVQTGKERSLGRKQEEGLLHFQEVNGKKNKRPFSAHGVSPWNTKQFPRLEFDRSL